MPGSRTTISISSAYFLSGNVGAEDPAVGSLEQALVAHVPAELCPVFFGFLCRFDDRGVVFLCFRDGVADEFDVGLDGRGDVGEGSVGAGDHEEVGEVGYRAAQIGCRPRVPVVLECVLAAVWM